jgi:choice-of-anchor A domain-containing protein
VTHLAIISAVAISALSTVAANAGPLTASQILANYNIVTRGNATTSSDIEGSAVIGGNFNGATMFGNHAPAHPEIDIYGTNTSSPNANLNVNGGIVHYGVNTGHFNLNNGATAVQGSFPYTLSSFTSTLDTLSTQLAGLTSNSVISTGNGKVTFSETPGTNGIAVFSLTAAALQADFINNSLFFSGSATSIIINVSGNFAEPSGSNWNPPVMQNVMFNFYDATSVSVGNWESSLLAPSASVSITGGGNINGFVYANTFNGGGELHNDPFLGNLPVPEPGTFALFGLALVGLVVGKTATRQRSIMPAA